LIQINLDVDQSNMRIQIEYFFATLKMRYNLASVSDLIIKIQTEGGAPLDLKKFHPAYSMKLRMQIHGIAFIFKAINLRFDLYL
jgi:hypothetical protein